MIPEIKELYDTGQTIHFTSAELAAILDFFPRVVVANVVEAGSPLHAALLKLAPLSLPTRLRFNDKEPS